VEAGILTKKRLGAAKAIVANFLRDYASISFSTTRLEKKK
jgi:hypothetical protein